MKPFQCNEFQAIKIPQLSGGIAEILELILVC